MPRFSALGRARRWTASTVSTDRAILRRVLDNLVKNAAEAASGGDRVELRYEAATRTFRVRNPQVMPESVRRRMFHRSFSTKAERGHGVGTWSVHLLTTRYLQGAVAFTSAEGQGTEFRIELPSAVVPDR